MSPTVARPPGTVPTMGTKESNILDLRLVRLERELAAANDRIAELEEFIGKLASESMALFIRRHDR